MAVSVLLQNVCPELGEGPHWGAEKKELLFVGIREGDIHRWDYATGEDTVIHIGGKVGFVLPCRRGGVVLGHNTSFTWCDPESGELNVLATLDGPLEDPAVNRINDGKCDPAGQLWAGTVAMGKLPEVGSLYKLDKDLSVSCHASTITISNGLCWTADTRTMLYIDSLPTKVYAFDYDLTTSTPSNQRVAFDWTKFGDKDTFGFPDGMCIDQEDKIWVACFGGGQVARIDPRTGTLLPTVQIPGAKQITSCCFGGPNLDELFVTSANLWGKGGQPNAGSLFKVTGLGVKGTAGVMFDY